MSNILHIYENFMIFMNSNCIIYFRNIVSLSNHCTRLHLFKSVNELCYILLKFGMLKQVFCLHVIYIYISDFKAQVILSSLCYTRFKGFDKKGNFFACFRSINALLNIVINIYNFVCL